MTNNRYTPLDVLEDIFTRLGHGYKRHNDELYALLSGHRGDYTLISTWIEDDRILYCSCDMSAKFDEHKIKDVSDLVFTMNEKLWLGHFNISLKNKSVGFVISNIIQEEHPCSELLEVMISIAVIRCDQFYSAFLSILGDKVPHKMDLDSSLMDIVGEA